MYNHALNAYHNSTAPRALIAPKTSMNELTNAAKRLESF